MEIMNNSLNHFLRVHLFFVHLRPHGGYRELRSIVIGVKYRMKMNLLLVMLNLVIFEAYEFIKKLKSISFLVFFAK